MISGDELGPGIPFSTAEPANYSAEIVVTTGDIVRRTFVARSGQKRRVDFDYGTPAQRTLLRTDREYVLDPAGKTYVVRSVPTFGADDDWSGFLTTTQLNDVAKGARFEAIQPSAPPVRQYRVILGEASEAVISYNETDGMIVKQEFYTVDGTSKTLAWTYELRDFKKTADEALFALPADFRQIEK